jgi:hypothetical protein
MMRLKRAVIFYLFFVYLSGTAPGSMISIGYDDGVAEDAYWLDGGLGHGVAFTSPVESWTLSEVAVCGMLNPKSDGEIFVLEIWDGDYNLLYARADVARSYFGGEMKWAGIDIPDLQVSGLFFVCLFEFSTIYVGADVGEDASLRSFVVSRSPNKIDAWDLPSPQNGTDWMISAVGRSPAPEAELQLTPADGGVLAEATIADEDANLASATIYVLEEGEVIWAERRQIEGSEAEVAFEWDRRSFRVTNGTEGRGRVFAIKTPDGICEDRAEYTAYSAPCILRLSAGGPRTAAVAHFGRDGKLHALADGSGFVHYLSGELFGLEEKEPGRSYGRYVRENITVIEGESELTFFTLNLREGMGALPPLMLARSAIHNFNLSLEEVDAAAGEHSMYVEVADSAGNIFRGSQMLF